MKVTIHSFDIKLSSVSSFEKLKKEEEFRKRLGLLYNPTINDAFDAESAHSDTQATTTT